MSKIVFIPGFVATVTTIVIDNTPIIGGASGRILFENAANQISESANFTYLAGIFNVTKTATHQAQFTFDANNYFRIKATSTGATELSATGTAPKFLFNADVDAQTNNVYATKIGVGTITPAAFLQVLGTTEQARFSYNAGRYLSITVDSNGGATILPTGSGRRILINPIAVVTSAYAAISLGAGDYTGITANKFIGSPSGTVLAVHPDVAFSGNMIDFQAYNAASWFRINVNNQIDIRAQVDLQMSLGRAGGAALNFTLTTGANALAKITSDYFTSEGNIYIGTYSNASNNANFTIDRNGFHGFNVAAPACLIHGIKTTEQLRIGYNTTNYSSFTVGSTGSLTIGLIGTTPRTTFSQGIDVLGTIKLNGYTVATLPAGVIGETAYVTDALAPIFLGIIAGGGAVVTPVFYNGANWIAQ